MMAKIGPKAMAGTAAAWTIQILSLAVPPKAPAMAYWFAAGAIP